MIVRIYLISFWGVILFSGLDSFAQENDLQKMNLKAKVKVLTTDECLIIKFKKGTNKICKIQRKYFFNYEGYLIKSQVYQFSKLEENLNYIYKDNELKSIQSINRDSTLRFIHKFSYDSVGNIINDMIFNNDKSLDTKYTYKYDKNNNKTEMIGYSMKNSGNLFIKETFKYDDLRNLIEQISGKRKYETNFKYNKENRIKQKTLTITNNGKLESKSTVYLIYNAYGNCIQEIELIGNKKVKTNYLFDEAHNWIEKKILESSDRIIITERKIEYY